MEVINQNLHVLYETTTLSVGNVFERVYLINKATQHLTCIGEIYGDPTWGLISDKEDWAIVGGQTLILWQAPNFIVQMEDEELVGSVRARQISPNELEILVDPFSDKSSVWLLNVDSLLIRQLITRDKLKGPWSDEIEW